MKKILVVALMAVAVVSASAQGRITFASAAAGVNAKFITSGLNGDPLGVKSITSADTTIRADLFWTVGSSTVGVTPGQLTLSGGLNQAFLSGAQAGYFAGGVKTLTGAAAATPIVAQVRVWDTAFGSYDVARTAPGAHWGESVLFVITPAAASPAVAPNLVGLGNPATYTLTYNPVPEPSSMALAGLGAAALLVFRRRK